MTAPADARRIDPDGEIAVRGSIRIFGGRSRQPDGIKLWGFGDFRRVFRLSREMR